MTTGEFAYWIQGALELNPDMLEKGMTPEQVQTIQGHLDLVFTKVTPDRFKKEGAVEPSPLNYDDILNPYNGTGNPPPSHPGSTSDTRFCSLSNQDSSELICSTLNQVLGVPEQDKEIWTTGCTTSVLLKSLHEETPAEKRSRKDIQKAFKFMAKC